MARSGLTMQDCKLVALQLSIPCYHFHQSLMHIADKKNLKYEVRKGSKVCSNSKIWKKFEVFGHNPTLGTLKKQAGPSTIKGMPIWKVF